MTWDVRIDPYVYLSNKDISIDLPAQEGPDYSNCPERESYAYIYIEIYVYIYIYIYMYVQYT